MENFYPTPGLLMLTVRTGKYIPIPLYSYYKEQADELNTVSVRLGRILAAIRVRGAYNGLLGDDLKKILAADGIDNELIAASEAGLLAQSGGFDKHIWMVPLEPLVKTAQELYKAREAIKQVIYELTGISDIIRGSSVASETATAQDLKNKWGTVRLRRMQTVVADYARDLFRMSVDCGADHIPPEKWAAITQMLEIPTAQQKAVAVQQLQYLQSQAMNPIPGMPPPQPPDPKLLQQAQSPTWEDLLGKIKNDINRTYVVNIQTSSTIDLDSAQDKGEVAEFMQAMGQLLPALQGLASIGPTGMEAAKAILVNICARFKFGIDIADVIAKIQPPPPPGPDPKDAAKAQESQVKSQQDQQKFQFDMKLGEQKMGMETQRFQMEQAKAQREEMAFQAEQEQKRLIAQEELALKREEMALKREEIRLKTKQLSDNAMYSQQEHTNKLQLLGETTKSNIAQAKQKAIAPKPEPKTTPEQSAAPIIQALEKGFASLTKELTQTITQAAKAPRKAVKSSDGSWTSVAH